jgi:HD-like signal output (HDOD) protein
MKYQMNVDIANKHPSIDDAFERTIKDLGIPPRPVILDRFKEEMRKDTPNVLRLSQIISSDVSLSAGLMKVVNSAYFGLRRKVDSVGDALTMLGLDASSRAITAACLRGAFPSTPVLERFWNASAQVAALSGWLAKNNHKSMIRSDVAYTFGLFRDIGIAILLIRYPHYVETLARANLEIERSFTDVEQCDFLTDHGRVGYVLAMNWNLSEEMCFGIRWHHDLLAIDQTEYEVTPASRYLIATSQTAEYVLQCITGLSSTMEWKKLGPACLRILDLSEDDLPALCEAGADILKTVE